MVEISAEVVAEVILERTKKQSLNSCFSNTKEIVTLLTAVVRRNGERPLSDFDNLSN
jgi:hypothetical protein